MAKSGEHLKRVQRDRQIYAEYLKLGGRGTYRYEYLCRQLADKYWLQPITIERILVAQTKRAEAELNSKQNKLF